MYADRDHRVDAGRDRGDGPPARGPGALQRRARDHARSRSSRRSATSTTGCASWPRRAAPYEAGGGGRDLDGADEGARWSSSSRGSRRRCGPPRENLEFERAAALRDEIQQIRLRVLAEDASVIVGRAAAEAAGAGGAAPAAGGRAAPTGRPGASGAGAGAAPVGARSRRWRSRRSRVVAGRRRAGRSPRGPPPTGCRASATSTTTRTTAAGRPAGSTARPGTAPSPRTSATGPGGAGRGARGLARASPSL